MFIKRVLFGKLHVTRHTFKWFDFLMDRSNMTFKASPAHKFATDGTLHIGSYLGATILIYDKVVKWYDLALKANICKFN